MSDDDLNMLMANTATLRNTDIEISFALMPKHAETNKNQKTWQAFDLIE